MTRARRFPVAALLGLGALMGWVAHWQTATPFVVDKATAQESGPETRTDVGLLKADVEVLKQKASDQAHVMVSVAYHFNNLWFAGQHANWPLAQFYWNEVRSHLRWAVRVIPIRKDNAGKEIHLGDILQAVESTPLAQLQAAIEAQDMDQFVAAYKFSLESCYACHKAADKPYLRPQIPAQPAEPTINFDPAATWPQ